MIPPQRDISLYLVVNIDANTKYSINNSFHKKLSLLPTGKISGFLLAERCGEELHICEFAVESPRQGQGIGTLLLQAAIAYARAMGLKALTLTTFRELSWNEPFYHHSGFETLAASDLNERLVAAFAREVLIGLPIGRRCAMRLVLSRLR